ncbi:MAG: hypothetical protein ABTD50_02735 [Polyangiaceae bacterium]|jgi:hypothetical protein
MMDVGVLDDEEELGDLPPLDGLAGDDEPGADLGADYVTDDLPSDPLEDIPFGDDSAPNRADVTGTPGWPVAGDEATPQDVRESLEAANLSLGDDAIVAFLADDGVAEDDGTPPVSSTTSEDLMSDPLSAPAGTDGGEDGPLSADDFLRDLDLPPLDADEEGDTSP